MSQLSSSRTGKVADRRGPRDGGLTLIELMITIVVASLVAASTFVFFAGQQRIYDTQTKLLNVQQSVTAAMELLTRYVRASGTGMLGCVRPDSDGAGPDPGDAAPVGPATPLTAAPAAGLRAYLNGTGAIRIPPIWITNGAGGAPDTITVAFGNGSFGNWTDSELGATVPKDTPTGAVVVPAPFSTAFRANEFAILLDSGQTVLRATPLYGDRGCTLFQITGIDTPGNQLLHASTSKWNPAANVANLVPFDYVGGSSPTPSAIRNLGTLNWVRFAIAPGSATTAPALTMERLDLGTAPEVLSDGIEDLQVAYACDNNPDDGELPDGTPTKLTDEWVLNVAADPIPANCNRPDAVRITLIARSLTADSLLSGVTANAKPAVEDGAAGATDSFRHRVVTTTVFLRN
jgi:prepilin-type N-terminal cleavage/methylation domain-containing protein